jgi:hypothetical protein
VADSCRPVAGRSASKSPSIIVPVVGSLFFPTSKLLGIEPDSQLTPAALKKVVHAGVHAGSFRQAEADLVALAELPVSNQRIRRATVRIGQERVARRDEEVEAFLKLPLPEQQRSPTDRAPSLACVEMDGGRIQIRDRKAKPTPGNEPTDSSRKGRFWRESKVGCLLSMESETHAEDPCPTIPLVFVDPRRMNQMSREIKGLSSEAEPTDQAEEASDAGRKRPDILVKTVIASREDIHAFGRQLAAAAWQRGFAGAARKAFVCDGLAANWTVWRKHFSHYTPILDFVHAVMYVYAAAMAGRTFSAGWNIYCRWAQAVWSGHVEEVIDELHSRQQEIGVPEKDDPEHSPRCLVADALRYLTNQQPRMRYDEYRRQGLPITSSHIESTIKQINRRVKGSEKFWSTGGAEALLQLSADYLSETDPLTPFWQNRQSSTTGQRHHQAA